MSGLGDGAYWDETFRTLNALEGRYWLSAEVESGAGVDTARKALSQAIERLP